MSPAASRRRARRRRLEDGTHRAGGQEQLLRDLVDVQAGGREVADPPLPAGEPPAASAPGSSGAAPALHQRRRRVAGHRAGAAAAGGVQGGPEQGHRLGVARPRASVRGTAARGPSPARSASRPAGPPPRGGRPCPPARAARRGPAAESQRRGGAPPRRSATSSSASATASSRRSSAASARARRPRHGAQAGLTTSGWSTGSAGEQVERLGRPPLLDAQSRRPLPRSVATLTHPRQLPGRVQPGRSPPHQVAQVQPPPSVNAAAYVALTSEMPHMRCCSVASASDWRASSSWPWRHWLKPAPQVGRQRGEQSPGGVGAGQRAVPEVAAGPRRRAAARSRRRSRAARCPRRAAGRARARSGTARPPAHAPRRRAAARSRARPRASGPRPPRRLTSGAGPDRSPPPGVRA